MLTPTSNIQQFFTAISHLRRRARFPKLLIDYGMSCITETTIFQRKTNADIIKLMQVDLYVYIPTLYTGSIRTTVVNTNKGIIYKTLCIIYCCP